MSRFRVTAHMKAPIIFGGGYATLDALLAALLFDRLDDVEAAHAAVPLANTKGLFHASAAIYEPSRHRPDDIRREPARPA